MGRMFFIGLLSLVMGGVIIIVQRQSNARHDRIVRDGVVSTGSVDRVWSTTSRKARSAWRAMVTYNAADAQGRERTFHQEFALEPDEGHQLRQGDPIRVRHARMDPENAVVDGHPLHNDTGTIAGAMLVLVGLFFAGPAVKGLLDERAAERA